MRDSPLSQATPTPLTQEQIDQFNQSLSVIVTSNNNANPDNNETVSNPSPTTIGQAISISGITPAQYSSFSGVDQATAQQIYDSANPQGRYSNQEIPGTQVTWSSLSSTPGMYDYVKSNSNQADEDGNPLPNAQSPAQALATAVQNPNSIVENYLQSQIGNLVVGASLGYLKQAGQDDATTNYKNAIAYLGQNGVSPNDIQTLTNNAIANGKNIAASQNANSGNNFVNNLVNSIGSPAGIAAIVANTLLPGSALLVNAATQIASGVPVDKIIENAGISALAPTVGNAISSASGIPSIIDSTLSDANLVSPSNAAINKAIGTTVLNAGADVLSNKDPTQALNAGVGSLVGSVAGANTGTDSNAVNNAVGSAVGAATTAGLNDTNVGTAIGNSLISSALNSAGKSLKNTDTSGTTPTDTNTTPTTTAGTTETNTTPTTTPTETNTTAPTIAYIQDGEAFDSQNHSLGSASSLGLTSVTDENGNDVYVDTSGNVINGAHAIAVEGPGSVQTVNLPPMEPAPAEISASALKAPPVSYVDSNGNAFDSNGNTLGAASSLGLIAGTTTSGTPTYIDTNGNNVPVQGVSQTTPTETTPTTTGTTGTTETTPTTTGTTGTTETTPTTTAGTTGTTETTPTNTTPTSTTPSIDATGVVDNSGMATFKGDGQPGDYPTQIITNNDGSVTTVENNGTSLTLNTDGSIVQSHGDGSTSNPLNTDLPPGVYPDGNGGFTDIFGNPVTATGQSLTYDSKGNLIDSNGNVYQYTPTIDNTPPTNTNTGGAGSIGGIGTIGGKGISGGKGGGSGSGGGSGLGTAITGLGVIAANLLNNSSGTLQNTGLQSLTNTGSFGWNPNQIVGPENGVAYGQQILNPTYTKNAKEGGMVNHLASNGEVTMNPITFKQGGDVHREIYNALKQSGHPVDGDTLSKIAHLNSMGAPSHHIVGFLNHQRMSSGGPLGAYSDGGHFLKGPGDGMSDDIPARIGGHQEARLANEEFVIPADVVSHLGNGSSEAGAKVLYKMMDKIRHARTGTTKQGKQINPDKFMPK